MGQNILSSSIFFFLKCLTQRITSSKNIVFNKSVQLGLNYFFLNKVYVLLRVHIFIYRYGLLFIYMEREFLKYLCFLPGGILYPCFLPGGILYPRSIFVFFIHGVASIQYIPTRRESYRIVLNGNKK